MRVRGGGDLLIGGKFRGGKAYKATNIEGKANSSGRRHTVPVVCKKEKPVHASPLVGKQTKKSGVRGLRGGGWGLGWVGGEVGGKGFTSSPFGNKLTVEGEDTTPLRQGKKN